MKEQLCSNSNFEWKVDYKTWHWKKLLHFLTKDSKMVYGFDRARVLFQISDIIYVHQTETPNAKDIAIFLSAMQVNLLHRLSLQKQPS